MHKLDSILNKKHGDVIANNIPIALGGIHLDGEPAHVTDSIGTALLTLHRRKAQEQRCRAEGICQDPGGRHVLGALV